MRSRGATSRCAWASKIARPDRAHPQPRRPDRQPSPGQPLPRPRPQHRGIDDKLSIFRRKCLAAGEDSGSGKWLRFAELARLNLWPWSGAPPDGGRRVGRDPVSHSAAGRRSHSSGRLRQSNARSSPDACLRRASSAPTGRPASVQLGSQSAGSVGMMRRPATSHQVRSTCGPRSSPSVQISASWTSPEPVPSCRSAAAWPTSRRECPTRASLAYTAGCRVRRD